MSICGWNAEERLRQRISLENQKDPNIWDTAPGLAALVVHKELKKLSDAGLWKKHNAEEVFTRIVEIKKKSFSDKELILFRWMSFHIYLGGTPTSNPDKDDLFGYFHGAMSSQCEFMYDHMKGPGLIGLYASCGYTKYSKEMDTWIDEKMDYVTDMILLASEDLEWAVKKKHSIIDWLRWLLS